jgi:hypothetical protein
MTQDINWKKMKEKRKKKNIEGQYTCEKMSKYILEIKEIYFKMIIKYYFLVSRFG